MCMNINTTIIASVGTSSFTKIGTDTHHNINANVNINVSISIISVFGIIGSAFVIVIGRGRQ